jgi:hypothetical protein
MGRGPTCRRGLTANAWRDPEGAKWPSKRALPAAERSRWCAVADATDRAPEDRFRAACGDRRDRRAGLADVETCLSSLSIVAKFQSGDRVGERSGGCCVGHRNRPVLAASSLATSQGVLGLEDLCGAFADDDAGGHGVSGGDAGHDRPVSDTEVVDSIDFQLAIDH